LGNIRCFVAFSRRPLPGAVGQSGRSLFAESIREEDDEIMEQSIRNEIPGIVKEIISDKVLSEIIVECAIGEVAAIITTRSVKEMGLQVGDRVAALVKATNVSVRRRT
jgi:molybdopterin-binding protein